MNNHPTRHRSHTVAALLACWAAFTALAAGCANSGSPRAAESAVTISPTAARGVPIFRGDGSAANWGELVAAVDRADIVILGENHGHPLGLAAAASLWDDLLARNEHAALALEFFERDEQSRLDDYLMGVVDEPTFRKRAARTDSNYPPGHRAMVEAAKAHHRPVIAANAPIPYVRFARLKGYDQLASLTPEQRRLFRVPDELPADDSPYRQRFDEVMGGGAAVGHGKETEAAEQKSKLDATFRSQSMWDWTMAESMANAAAGGNQSAVLVVGRFHCDFEGGLVLALHKLRPGAKVLVVSFVDADAPMRNEDKGRADFVVYVGRSR